MGCIYGLRPHDANFFRVADKYPIRSAFKVSSSTSRWRRTSAIVSPMSRSISQSVIIRCRVHLWRINLIENSLLRNIIGYRPFAHMIQIGHGRRCQPLCASLTVALLLATLVPGNADPALIIAPLPAAPPCIRQRVLRRPLAGPFGLPQPRQEIAAIPDQ
jgi:hypothetical protein